jgi:hypothetical protein
MVDPVASLDFPDLLPRWTSLIDIPDGGRSRNITYEFDEGKDILHSSSIAQRYRFRFVYKNLVVELKTTLHLAEIPAQFVI